MVTGTVGSRNDASRKCESRIGESRIVKVELDMEVETAQSHSRGNETVRQHNHSRRLGWEVEHHDIETRNSQIEKSEW